MSSQKFAIPFRLQLQRSFVLSVSLFVLYMGALVFMSMLTWPVWLKLALSLFIVLSFVSTMKRHVLFKGREAVIGLVCEDGERWLLESASGERLEAKLLSSTSMQPWLAVMNFRVEGERRAWPVVVMPDSTDSTTYRRLHAKLRRLAPAAT